MEMIKVNFSPVRSGKKTELSASSSTITLNGKSFDLSLLEDGATAEHDQLGLVTRNGSDYEVTVALYHGKDAPEETRFPKPVELSGLYEYDFGGDE
jgi:hypothetical protein